MNTSLGEVWEEQGDALAPAGLMARLEEYEREGVPILAVTAGVDVQKDRLEATFVGWGKGEEAWLLDHVIVPGDTARTEVWAELADLVGEFKPDAVAIDSGYNSDQVYEFCGRRRFAFAIKGVTGFARPLIEDAKRRAQRLRRAGRKGTRVEPIGVDGGKVLIYSRLRQADAGPGFIHFPADAAFDEEYFQQLAAEKLVIRKRFGRPSQEWVQTRPRNEALDCLVYALAALRLANLDLTKLAERRATGATGTTTEHRPKLPQRVNIGGGLGRGGFGRRGLF